MTAADLIAFNIILAGALISPGLASLFALRAAIADGRPVIDRCAAALMGSLGMKLILDR